MDFPCSEIAYFFWQATAVEGHNVTQDAKSYGPQRADPVGYILLNIFVIAKKLARDSE